MISISAPTQSGEVISRELLAVDIGGFLLRAQFSLAWWGS
jgi:hypothetical protein